MDTPNGRAEIEAIFGNPANSDGTLNEAWEGANIRKIPPPDGWRLFYQADTGLVSVCGFNFRPITSGKSLSLHAIDWDADHNPRQKPLKKTLPNWWYDIWKTHGWADGRKFPTPDPMHVQFARGA